MKSKQLSLLLILFASLCWQIKAQPFNYADALQKSIFFYECQRSGPLPADNRVNWRGDSGLNDGADVSKDLTGGWYDAGDNVKFNFPMAFTATALAWGAIDFQNGYVKTGQQAKIKESLRWVNDYFIKCHTAPNELYGQVGNGGLDHAFWGACEIMQMARPSYKIDAANPGSDLAGETAASMAAASIVFKTDDPAYSATLLAHAKQLYAFADTYRGKYSSAITDVTPYYNSWSGYQDELVWGAIWLYRATNDAAYLAKAESEYAKLSNEGQEPVKSYKWAIAWDDKTYGCYVLLAKLTGKAIYQADAERHLNYWCDEKLKTPGGLVWNDTWGSLRYASNTAFLALMYSDYTTDTAKKTKYFNFAARQINYTLGDNPGKRSFVCGFGVNPPINPHHRTAHGCWSNNLTADPVNNRHTIYGALVGGPDASDKYTDSRSDYVSNEIACDYNACFTGALARLATDYNSTPTVIQPEIASGEFYCDSKINAASSTFFEPAVFLYNHSAWPARVTTKMSFRYFIDITEGVALGKTIADYSVRLSYGQGGSISPLKLWSGNIYYCEISFIGEKIYPGGQSECRREAQFRFTGPAGAWDNSNDPSYEGITNTLAPNLNIAVYDNGSLVGGKEPGPSVTYNVVATAGAGGSISPAGTTKVSKGSNETYTITANAGYKVSSTKVDGVAVALTNNTYTFTNVTANHTIDVTFVKAPTFTINATAGAGGTISPNALTTVTEGANQIYTIQGDSGYKVSSVIVDGVNKGALNSYTFTNIGANHTIEASFVVAPVYTITATQSANGTISPAGVTNVNEGESKTYTITPASNYKVSDVLVNGVSVGAVTTYTIANVTANTTIEATFAQGTLLTTYGVPRATALPSINAQYEFVSVIGVGGPNLSNVSKFDINWDLANKGLYTLSFNINDGKPDWYISFLSKITHTFSTASPDVKFTESGIAGFDGEYWVNIDGENFVMVAKSGNYAIYFSKTRTTIKSASLPSDESTDFNAQVSPNPILANGNFTVTLNTTSTGTLSVYDMQGIELLNQPFAEQKSINVTSNLAPGIYFIRISNGDQNVRKKIIVR